MARVGLTYRQFRLLKVMSHAPRGVVLTKKPLVDALLSMVHSVPALVSDVYEMQSGGYSGRITEAGRRALEGSRSDG